MTNRWPSRPDADGERLVRPRRLPSQRVCFKTRVWRVLSPDSPTGCSAKGSCHGSRLRARRGAPSGATRAPSSETLSRRRSAPRCYRRPAARNTLPTVRRGGVCGDLLFALQEHGSDQPDNSGGVRKDADDVPTAAWSLSFSHLNVCVLRSCRSCSKRQFTEGKDVLRLACAGDCAASTSFAG